MTVLSTTRKAGPYIGTGLVSSYGFTFKVFEPSDLLVVWTDTTGTEQTLVLGTHYSVTLNADQDASPGGTVLLVSPLAATTALTIRSQVPVTQSAQLLNLGAFLPRVIEGALDRLTILVQQALGLVANTLRLPSSVADNVSRVLPLPEASKLLGWSTSANALQNYDLQALATVIAYGTMRADSFVATAGQSSFTLTYDAGPAANIDLAVDGITYTPNSDFTVVGRVITLAVPLAAGSEVSVRYGQALQQVTDPEAVVLLGNLQGTPSGAFFAQNGANIYRMVDRLLLGGATLNDGRFPNVAQDWLTQFQIAAGLPGGAITSTQFAVLNAGASAETGAVGITAGIQSRYFNSAGTNAIASSAYVVNNNLTLATSAWAFYAEAHKTSSAAGSIYGMELDTRATVVTVTPNAWQQGDVVALQLASGAELGGTQFDGSAAIQLARNPAKWKVGINVLSDAITGTDGATGLGVAVSLSTGHALRWYGTGGTTCATVWTEAGMSASNGTGLRFGNAGAAIMAGDGGVLLQVAPLASAVNNLQVSGAISGNSPSIAAVGTGTDLDVVLTPKGAGAVRVTGLAARNYANDTAAAAGGVPINGLYHNSGALRVRLS